MNIRPYVNLLGLGVAGVLLPAVSLAVGGQSWDTPPPSEFSEATMVQINCADYRSRVDALVGDVNKVLSPPPGCGTTFSFHQAVTETFGSIPEGTKVWVCLATSRTSVFDCIASNDSTLFASVYRQPRKQDRKRAVFSYQPVVTISSPKTSGVFSSSLDVVYQALDQNDASPEEQASHGLGANPVSVYYTTLPLFFEGQH
ncbi:MAG: hypothetical protein HY454_00390, partial [Parcubacteria group bacterium]|nr:hypothetical protein [Parcubacteria group bacterium]